MLEVRAEHYRSRDLIEALLAVLGIWVTVRYVPDYIVTLGMLWNPPSRGTVDTGQIHALQALHFGVSVLLGAALIVARKHVARWLNPRSHSSNADPGALVAAGAAIVGVFYIAEGSTALGSHYLVRPSTEAYSLDATVLHGWISVAVGASLFTTSVGIGRLWLLLGGKAEPGAQKKEALFREKL